MDKKNIVEQTMYRYEQYVNPAMARLFRFMGLSTIEWKASGCLIEDIDGKTYIDCLGGYGTFSLGHRHPKVLEAVKAQLERIPLSSKIFLNEPLGKLSELLAEITPGDLQYSFFCNSGAEAVEGALKFARLQTGREKFIATTNSFHGKTFGALSATGRDLFRNPFQPLMQGFSHIPFGDIAAMEAAVDEHTAAVIIEPIQGEGGIIVPSDDYLPKIREFCDKHGALLICDEVQTGLGRTGKMFASDHCGVIPDIMTSAKALGGGVMPIGAFMARPFVWDKFIESPFLHTSTFGGSPLACAAGVAAVEVIKEENLPEKAAILGAYFMEKLQALQAAFPGVIREVRGRGLMLGIELSKEGIGGFLMAELIQAGVIVAYTLNNPKVIRIEPPLIITEDLIDKVIDILARAVEQANDMLEDL